MSLASPEYIELNKQLHASRDDYGAGAFRWTQMVEQLKDELEAETVLDYGCGKGTLGLALGHPEWLREYDPAIPGKDEVPTGNIDLVVCLDVLEHIEPDHLDDVLEHLRRIAKKGLFVVISTQPSTKTLPDGRNAHVSLHSAGWWRTKLETYFLIGSWQEKQSSVVAVLRRLHMLGDVRVISAVSDTIRFEQAVENIRKCAKRIRIQPRHDGKVAIACYGPSLRLSIPALFAAKAEGAQIVSVSGAHDFLIERDLVPDIHIDVDPRPHKGFFTRNPHPGVKYWMASCCHPTVIDNLLNSDLTLFHIFNGNEDVRIIDEHEPDGFLVGGGGSVGCRAMSVMYSQGYRRFQFYGMDCSFDDDGDQHAGPHSGKQQKGLKARCGDRWFKTSGTLVAIARGFMDNVEVMEGMSRRAGEPGEFFGDCLSVEIAGDGLLAAMVRHGTKDVALHVADGSESAYTKESVEAA